MIWTLVFIMGMRDLDIKHVGYFDTYEKCHSEAAWQTEESDWKDQWACVQTKLPELPTPPKKVTDDDSGIICQKR